MHTSDSYQYFVVTKPIKTRDCGYTAKDIIPSLGIIFRERRIKGKCFRPKNPDFMRISGFFEFSFNPRFYLVELSTGSSRIFIFFKHYRNCLLCCICCDNNYIYVVLINVFSSKGPISCSQNLYLYFLLVQLI